MSKVFIFLPLFIINNLTAQEIQRDTQRIHTKYLVDITIDQNLQDARCTMQILGGVAV
jgi:hypothetical protein